MFLFWQVRCAQQKIWPLVSGTSLLRIYLIRLNFTASSCMRPRVFTLNILVIELFSAAFV